MPSFGEQLRRERERRNTSIDEIASTTKIGRGYLEALERNKFDGLPGSAFGKFYIRAYAEVLGFDPQPLIAEYDRERMRRNRPDPAEAPPRPAKAARPRRRPRAWLQEKTDTPPQTVPDPVPVEPPPEPPRLETAEPPEPQPPAPEIREDPPILAGEPPREPTERPSGLRFRNVALLAAGILSAGAWIYFANPEQALAPESVPVDPVLLPAPPPEPVEAPQETAPSVPTSTPSRMSVADFGLGRGIQERRLVGRSERFEEGEVAWFSTRVLGGQAGEPIRHVWRRKGAVVESIPLELGGPHWRTHSRKTLWGVGRWTVEVLDRENRVLATAGFDCLPAGSG